MRESGFTQHQMIHSIPKTIQCSKLFYIKLPYKAKKTSQVGVLGTGERFMLSVINTDIIIHVISCLW